VRAEWKERPERPPLCIEIAILFACFWDGTPGLLPDAAEQRQDDRLDQCGTGLGEDLHQSHPNCSRVVVRSFWGAPRVAATPKNNLTVGWEGVQPGRLSPVKGTVPIVTPPIIPDGRDRFQPTPDCPPASWEFSSSEMAFSRPHLAS
jgi:hypothetical protein